MTLVKICGLRTSDAALAAASFGADYLGFIFAPSRRQVSPSDVAGIRTDLRAAGLETPLVGVFVDPDPGYLREAVAESGIDLVQLSGEEDPALFAGCSTPIIKAIPAGATDTLESIEAEIDRWPFALHFLLDASDPTARGGTGKLANWVLARDISHRCPVLLAGGLTPANVGDAISAIAPAGVDVSSGVERDGAKDVGLIERFVRAARS